jgi:hypothetical protein
LPDGFPSGQHRTGDYTPSRTNHVGGVSDDDSDGTEYIAVGDASYAFEDDDE